LVEMGSKMCSQFCTRNLILTVILLFAAGVRIHSQAEQAAQPHSAGETLSAEKVKQLEKSAKTAADHERLAAYYESQLQQAQKNLADAQELEKKWGPIERTSKTPDPYPHSRRLVRQYSAEVAKYSQLAASHHKLAQSIEAANAGGGKAGTSKGETSTPKQDAESPTLGPKK
jgi:hypothetical protein